MVGDERKGQGRQAQDDGNENATTYRLNEEKASFYKYQFENLNSEDQDFNIRDLKI